ncbi:kiSS-1 receptor [Nematostella vectensis]|uniref:kiSS-1 receptor n=1 Tax=Nematostella vectensis TaxID=45351 RepID=UPI002076F5DB|nr:kiSS-1 receptor [Nematostella vectensis]
MVLYLVKQRPVVSRRAFQRTLTRHFIRSLAYSSLLSSLVSTPLLAAELLGDFLQSDWACRFQIYFLSVFVLIAISNLIVIGVERYLTIFHPSKLPTTDTCKRLVMASWFVGAFMTIAYPGSITVLKRFELGEGQYTLHCSSNSVELTKVLRITSLIIQYIIPAVSLTVMSVRVLKFLHRRRQQAHPLQVNSTFNASMRSTLWYYKDSYMFASLTLAFVFPYAAPILYAIVRAFIPGESSFSEYYVVRIVALFMCYSNTIINPIIYLYCMRDMRKRVREILSRVCACCVTMETTPPVVEIEIKNLPHQRLEVRPPCVGVVRTFAVCSQSK